MSSSNVQVYGRKFSLLSLRNKLLKAHKRYMQFPTDSHLASLTQTELVKACRTFDFPTEANMQAYQLRQLLAKQQRQRSLVIWQDHITVLNSDFIMVTLHILYDHAVFLTKVNTYRTIVTDL